MTSLSGELTKDTEYRTILSKRRRSCSVESEQGHRQHASQTLRKPAEDTDVAVCHEKLTAEGLSREREDLEVKSPLEGRTAIQAEVRFLSRQSNCAAL